MTKNNPVTKPQTAVQISALQEQLARALADYANLEKRVESQRQFLATLATANMLNKIVPVLDDLHLAQTHLKDSGLQMALDKLRQVIKSEGVEEINPTDQVYDPMTMDCLKTEPGEDKKVLSVVKIGYKLNDQVLRPAQVVVGTESIKN